MDEINFLSGGQGDLGGKKKKKEEEKIEWKEPTKEERADKIDLSKDSGAAKAADWFKFLKKEVPGADQDKKILTGQPDGRNGLTDIKKIKSAREDLINIIKTEEKRKPIQKEKPPKKEKSSFFAWFNGLFRHKEKINGGFLKDYQTVVHQEEKKIIEPVMPKFEEKKKEIVLPPPPPVQVKEKPVVLKVEKALGAENRLKKLFKKIFAQKEKKPAQEIKKEAEVVIKKEEKKEEKVPKEIVKPKEEGQKETPHILKTNLAEGEIFLFFNWKKNVSVLLFSVMAACLLLFAAYEGLIFWEKQVEEIESESIVGDLNRMDKSIKQFERKVADVLFFQKKLELAGELLNNHIYWANFLNFFSEITIPGIEYTRTIGGESGVNKYAIDAKAKDFKTILTQVNLMRLNDYIKKVEVKGGKMSVEKEKKEEEKKEEEAKKEEKSIGNKIDFKLEFEIDPIIFLKGPIIKDIEPKEGAVGQYVTIYGINFRDYDEDESEIKFYNSDDDIYEDADSDFLSPCKDNWWHNSYIVAKVPKIKPGNWLIAVVNGEGEVKFSIPFKVNEDAPGPGICFISPDYGSEDEIVNIYGEGFGDKEGFGGAEYYDNKFGKIISWSDERIKSQTPSQAGTGALRIEIDSGAKSNGLIYKRLD